MNTLRSWYQSVVPQRWRGPLWHYRTRLARKYAKHLEPGTGRCLRDFFMKDEDWDRRWLSGLGDLGPLLYGLVRAARPTTIVEIGSARGKSTCYLALACKHNGHGRVHSIDPHTATDWNDRHYDPESTYDYLTRQLRRYGLAPWCETIRARTGDALPSWDSAVDLLFIDGDHSLEGVRRDFEGFRPWLRPDALVLFHDSTWARHDPKYRAGHPEIGVDRFLQELQGCGYPSITIPVGPGLTLLQNSPGGFDFVAPARCATPELAGAMPTP
jgi:predicted O-methyltransferase YrrM